MVHYLTSVVVDRRYIMMYVRMALHVGVVCVLYIILSWEGAGDGYTR